MSQLKLDSLDFSRFLYKQEKQSLAFQAKTAGQARRWQKTLRGKLKALLGGFPSKKIPLAPKVLRRKKFKEYTRETIVFQSRPGLDVYGHLLVPVGFKAPGPCVICLPGHGRGVDSICGVDAKGKMRSFGKWEEYQMDFALQCVAQGFAVFAVEQLGFGHRRDKAATKRGVGDSSCQPAAGAALLLGQTMAGWRVWDVIQSLDYLETRREIDPKRLAAMGISGGGTVALYAAASDSRLKAAMLSCSFNTFRDSIFSISHCIDNYVPEILKTAEMRDIAGLIAPRALFVEAGAKDDIFPLEATRRAYEETKRIFRLLGAENKIGLEVFKDEHRFWGKKAFEFLKRNI